MFQELMVMENSNNCTTLVGTQCMNEMMMPRLSSAQLLQPKFTNIKSQAF
jgi:hypothetical protein